MSDIINEDVSVASKHMAKNAWLKLQKWYNTTDTKVLAVSAVLDPCIKIAFFKKVLRWPQDWIDSIHNKVRPQYI